MDKVKRREFLIKAGKAIPAFALLSAVQSCTTIPKIITEADLKQVNVDEFISLSSVLTGQPESMLDQSLAKEYIVRLKNTQSMYWNKGDLNRLLTQYAAILKSGGDIPEKVNKEILGDAQCNSAELDPDYPYRYLAREIVFIWYTSAIYDENDNYVFGSAAAYVGGLAWRTGDGHPQAQCGGPLGYWGEPAGKITSWNPPEVCNQEVVLQSPCKQKSQPPGEPLLPPYNMQLVK